MNDEGEERRPRDKAFADVDLDTVAGGALPEKFEHALLERVLPNIMDPNTEPTDVRKITMEVAFKPEQDRCTVPTSVKVKVKLADPKADTGVVHVGERRGELAAVTYDPSQQDLFGPEDEDDDERVTPIDARERAGDA